MSAAIVSKVVAEADPAACAELLNLAKSSGVSVFKGTGIEDEIKKAMDNGGKKANVQRLGAVMAFSALQQGVGKSSEPFLASLFGSLLNLYGDKDTKVAEAAKTAGKQYVQLLGAHSVSSYVPILLENMDSSKRWQTVVGALSLLSDLSDIAPVPVAHHLGSIVPVVTPAMNDVKDEVKKVATETLTGCCEAIDNKDIEPLIPAIIEAIRNIEEVPECVQKLASTTFVQVVEGPALAIIVPLLLRGLKERTKAITATRRMCAVIINNMSKLVEEPPEAAPFLPLLVPALEKAKDEVSDPEARGVTEKALAQLYRIKKAVDEDTNPKADNASIEAVLKSKIDGTLDAYASKEVSFAAGIACSLAVARDFSADSWQKNVTPYLSFAGAKAKGYVDAAVEQCASDLKKVERVEEVDDAEELCNCKFTLAYGSKILLHNTEMRLMRGYRYGLLGGNDCGKTTLMRAIANEQVEGFPPASELRTVFVEADILGELSDLTCLNYVLADERIKNAKLPVEKVAETMMSVGFTQKMLGDGVTTLSGGWRMKLALSRAMLQRADILLLDEPTNHLDVINVAWVKSYLMSLQAVTSIIVSHDSGLLDEVCTHILQIDNLKLNLFKGNLSAFVAKVPEARSYFELKSEKQAFVLPQPGFLEGVKSKGKALMKMSGCAFTYPGNTKPTISGITVQVSLSSRVACVGVNGAGKSTMIKLLIGELEPQDGVVWKHPHVRVGYIAQHAFTHIENHLDKTPNQYIQWRYQYGDDKEALVKANLTLNEEEEAKCKQPVLVDGVDAKGNAVKVKKVITKLTGQRRENKKMKEYEYEVDFENGSFATRLFISQKILEKAGFTKHCNFVNEKISAREGMYKRPLTAANVEKHLMNVGLEAEYANHHRMSALSGGQKVKVVLAAAMWNQPHIVILDEPTNYLDRDSLGALAGAIKVFEGGIVMITHNNQFCSELCPETWVLENGTLDCRGDPEWMKHAMATKTEFKAVEEMVDAMGNTVEIKEKKKPKKEMSRQEKKKRAKIRAARIARGEEVSTDEEEDA
jgi:elongation factor 3